MFYISIPSGAIKRNVDSNQRLPNLPLFQFLLVRLTSSLRNEDLSFTHHIFQFLLVRLKGLGGEIISPPKVIGKKGGGTGGATL